MGKYAMSWYDGQVYNIHPQKIKEPLVDPTGSIFAVVEGKLLGKLSRDFCVSQIHTLTFHVVQR